MIQRRSTKKVMVGNVPVGGDAPISIQSMTNTRTDDVEATVAQIERLTQRGCEIIRCTVPDMESARALAAIRERISIPLVADIHFDYRMAIAAIENGADKIRINPGNIGGEDRVQAVVQAAKKKHVPIRVGVNSGSLERHIVERDGGVTPEGLCESALDKVSMIERCGYDNIVLSIKATDIELCVKAYELVSEKTSYPLHIGITEAGTVKSGTIRSAAGLGILLHEGIGDTVRVSLSGDPEEEVTVAADLLRFMGLRRRGIEVVACPTCGRTRIDVAGLAEQVEKMSRDYDLDIKVAVMGCAVNGPGEAKEADLGIAGGEGEGLIIRKGKILRKVREEELISALKAELDDWGKTGEKIVL